MGHQQILARTEDFYNKSAVCKDNKTPHKIISYAVFCFHLNNNTTIRTPICQPILGTRYLAASPRILRLTAYRGLFLFQASLVYLINVHSSKQRRPLLLTSVSGTRGFRHLRMAGRDNLSAYKAFEFTTTFTQLWKIPMETMESSKQLCKALWKALWKECFYSSALPQDIPYIYRLLSHSSHSPYHRPSHSRSDLTTVTTVFSTALRDTMQKLWKLQKLCSYLRPLSPWDGGANKT